MIGDRTLKLIKVCVEGGVPIGVGNVDDVSIADSAGSNPGDVSALGGTHRHTDHIIGAYIDTGMKVCGPQLTHRTCQGTRLPGINRVQIGFFCRKFFLRLAELSLR